MEYEFARRGNVAGCMRVLETWLATRGPGGYPRACFSRGVT